MIEILIIICAAIASSTIIATAIILIYALFLGICFALKDIYDELLTYIA